MMEKKHIKLCVYCSFQLSLRYLYIKNCRTVAQYGGFYGVCTKLGAVAAKGHLGRRMFGVRPYSVTVWGRPRYTRTRITGVPYNKW